VRDVLAVGFDFDHTLGIDHALERVAFYQLAAELGEPLKESDVAYRAQIDTLLSDFRAGTITLEGAVSRFVASLHGVHETDRADAERFREICYSLVPTHVEAMPGARELLTHLNRLAIPVAILTNGWSPLQQKKIAAVGFDGPVLVSDVIGAAKPSARAFRRLVETLALPPEAIWYVGDNPVADIGGAIAAGMRAAWVDHGELSYPQSQPPPTVRVADLHELIDRFPGPVEAVEKRG
jgi:putative hydrolase of the HAD superfamily